VHRGRYIASIALVIIVALGVGYYLTYVDPVWAEIPKGLDLNGGIYVILEAQDTPETPVTEEGISAAVEIIRRRVDALGVTEPVIQRQGDRRIIVELPGIEDPEEALRVIGKTAVLEFIDPEGNVVVTGKNLDEARAAFESTQAGQEPVVSLVFDREGAAKFAQATEKYVGQIITITLDGEVIQAPVVRTPIENGKAIIEGYPDLKSAQAVAIMLNSGALPVHLKTMRPTFVSATLGAESLAKSQQAAIIGMSAIVAFMILYYRVPGAWAVFALGIYILLVLLILAGINATLTLPGIAGLILSIGMAVDANVIIFERIKEEARAGKTPRAAIDSGFAQAFRTILDANVTTIIAAAVLYWLSSGTVRGFAVTLSIGILTSMLTAMVVTRFMLTRMARGGLVKAGPLFFGSGGMVR